MDPTTALSAAPPQVGWGSLPTGIPREEPSAPAHSKGPGQTAGDQLVLGLLVLLMTKSTLGGPRSLSREGSIPELQERQAAKATSDRTVMAGEALEPQGCVVLE